MLDILRDAVLALFIACLVAFICSVGLIWLLDWMDNRED